MNILHGKKFIIFGFASKRSIAYGICEAIAKLGGSSILCVQNEKLAEKAKMLPEALNIIDVFCADLGDDTQIEQVTQQIAHQYAPLDGIIHSVAYAPKEELAGHITDAISRDGFLCAQHISVYSFISLAKHAKHLMPNGGSMVCLSYIGANRAFPGYNIMGLAKASLESAVKYLALDLGKHQIRVNAISAGSIRTIAANAVEGFKELHEHNAKINPLSKSTTIEEVGDACAFLVSDLSRAITGDTLYVDNGFHAIGMHNKQEAP